MVVLESLSYSSGVSQEETAHALHLLGRDFSSQTTEVLTGNPKSLYLKESIHFIPQMKVLFFSILEFNFSHSVLF